MDIKELEELMKVFEESDLNEFELEEEGRRLRMQKNSPDNNAGALPTMIPQATQMVANASPMSVEVSADPIEAPAPEDVPAKTIDSPMVGTFYTSPAPGEPTFVQVGSSIDEGQTICIVEAMKLMNEVTAKSNCLIEKILVENGEPVEFGQPLFAIR
jgi:acetyl-CoA carboxylase biotin carboxyl carrier protein